MKYVCDLCGWVYDEAVGDPDHGIAPGTKFADLPEDFECSLPSKLPGSGEIPGTSENGSAFDYQVKRLWNPVDFLAISIAAQAAIKDMQ